MITQADAKKIFVLEDRPKLLNAYIKYLEKRGFYVKGAKSLEEAGKILESGESFDLLLLDMNLEEDPRASELNVYGSDVGEQFIKKQAAWPPEVLTMTLYNENVDFWRRSFSIGAAALLEKTFTSREATANYIRALLLRRAVSLNSPRCKEAIKNVLKKGEREYQMLEDFFRQLILPEFDACLGAPFILVLEHAEAAGEAADVNHECPQENESTLKEEISQLVTKAAYHARITDLKEPLRLDKEVFQRAALPTSKSLSLVFYSAHLDELSETEESINSGGTLPELLEDAAFVPLQLTPAVRLSLLLLKDKKSSKTSEDSPPLSLAKLLAKYSLDSIRMTLTNLIERWKHEQEIKQVQLQELARFCEYVGAETKRITFEARKEGLVPEKSTNFHRLILLADELCEAGEFLSDLAQGSMLQSQRLILQEIIQEAWDSLRQISGGSPCVLSFQGDCRATVMSVKEGLLFLFSRLLHWLVSFYEEGITMTPRIKIDCRLEGNYIELSFESDSVRLNKILRDNIFVPMTQRINYNQVLESKGPKLFLALYLAKTILEKRYKGNLSDHSDDLPEDVGHKLVIKMPVLNQ